MNKQADRFDSGSVYQKQLDQHCVNWSTQREYNLMFIKAQSNYFNDMLKARGHVFLNEVYDSLGFQRTSAGQIVGWLLNGDGDNYIDIQVKEIGENKFTVDFNVDGIIYEKI